MTGRLIYLTNYRFPSERAHGWQVVKTCEALGEQGVDVELWYPKRHQRSAEMDVDPVDYYGVRRSFATRALPNLDIFRIQRVLPARVFTVLYSLHAVVWGLFAALKAPREGSVCYTRDPVLAFWLTRFHRPVGFECHTIRKRLGLWFLKRLCGAPTLLGVAALTGPMRERLVGLGFPPGRVAVLPDAVDLDDYGSLPDTARCRERLGLPDAGPIVGYVGSFAAMGMEKGIGVLIEAVARVQTQPVPRLLCVGGPLDDEPRYRAEAERVGLGYERLILRDRVPRDEVPYWIRSCNVVSIPWPRNDFSELFTSPLKMFEYMASGVPIVASDLLSLRDVLRDGENSLLVEPSDPAALATAIERLLGDGDLSRDLAARAGADVRRYTWIERAKGLLTLVGSPNTPASRV